MASDLIVEIVKIDAVEPHPNPEVERLEVVKVKGWNCLCRKGQYKAGERCIYIPPDSILPAAYAEQLGVTSYLDKGRVRTIKLKGAVSMGLIAPAEFETGSKSLYIVGTNVAEQLGITKWEPPKPRESGPSCIKGYRAMEVTGFFKYTSIQNLRHYPHVIADGEEVVMVEKIHGTNVRFGYVGGNLVVGSHNTVRAPYYIKQTLRQRIVGAISNWWHHRPISQRPYDLDKMKASWYWYPYTLESVKLLLKALQNMYEGKDIIVYGETYGQVQKLNYGHPEGLQFAAFDIMVDGKYIGYKMFRNLCEQFGVPMAPQVYQGPYTFELAAKHSQGDSLMCKERQIREGVVVRPVTTRDNNYTGRTIFKMISEDYLAWKDGKLDADMADE